MQCNNVTLLNSGRFVRTGSRFLSSWMSLISRAFAPDGIFGMDKRFHRSGDYTTDTSDAPLSRSQPVASTFAFLTGNAAIP